MTAKKRAGVKKQGGDRRPLIQTAEEVAAEAARKEANRKRTQAARDAKAKKVNRKRKREERANRIAYIQSITMQDVEARMRPAYRLDVESETYVQLGSLRMHTLESAKMSMDRFEWQYREIQLWRSDALDAPPIIGLDVAAYMGGGLEEMRYPAAPPDSAVSWPALLYYTGLGYGVFPIPPMISEDTSEVPVNDDEWHDLLNQSYAYHASRWTTESVSGLVDDLYIASPVGSMFEGDVEQLEAIQRLPNREMSHRGRLIAMLEDYDVPGFTTGSGTGLHDEVDEVDEFSEALVTVANLAFRAGRETRDEEILADSHKQLMIAANFQDLSAPSKRRTEHTRVLDAAMRSFVVEHHRMPKGTAEFRKYIKAAPNRRWKKAMEKAKKGAFRKFVQRCLAEPQQFEAPHK